MKMSHDAASSSDDEGTNPMDKLLAKLSEQQEALSKQRELLKSSDDQVAYTRTAEYVSGTSTVALTTSALNSLNASTASTTNTPSPAGDDAAPPSAEEVLRLKLELEAAKSKLARMDEELAQSRITKHTLDQVIGTPSEFDFPVGQEVDDADIRVNNLQQGITPRGRSQINRDLSWAAGDDSRSDTSDTLSASGFNRAHAIWGNRPKPSFPAAHPAAANFQPSEALAASQWMNRGFGQPFVDTPMQYAGAHMNTFRGDRMISDPDLLMAPPTGRRNNVASRFNNRAAGPFSYAGSSGAYDGYTPVSSSYGSANGVGAGVGTSIGLGMSGLSAGMYSGYQPQPIGTPLSPHAPEFTSSTGWKGDVSIFRAAHIKLLTEYQAVATEGQTYLPTTEPLNYRRLLDRTVNCNWKYIVDKIVCNNDQQASIFLQQKLKVGTTEQKYDIVEAIVAQAYPLMVNRFGNFLVQRCFEHGTPEQVIKIADAIRGNTLNLSMDAFGCHVVQKAFDSVPEDYKAIMVHELLRRIPETVIHRYACHVWQKLFELRWTESPPQIMKYVNEALRGMWHEVALGETGSLVVQNIFENCLEEDKVSTSHTLISIIS
jgi:hypothetical protein